jgi:choline dehydrogenase
MVLIPLDNLMSDSTEYIVIGGGASGCAVTSKLLKNNKKVILFEAGHSHHNFLLDAPAGFFKLINNSKYATYHKTSPQEHLGERKNIIPQGNVLGGGTSINAQIYMRGRAEDYNEWQNILRGNNDSLGWSWSDVLPYFKEMENNSRLENEYHGKKGPLKISDSSHINQLTYDFINTVNNLGIPLTNDFNGAHQYGVGLYQFMNRKGKRSSSAHAFIDPEINNPNLTLYLNTQVQKIIIKDSKAIGVEFKDQKGKISRSFASKEVIISAGSFITPKLMMLSGIGNIDELSKHDIQCIVNLPGVGENLIDHPECPLIARANGKYGYYKQSHGWRMIKNGLEFLLFGTGPVNSTGVEAGAFINPMQKNELPYIQAFFVPSIYMNSDTIGVIKDDYGMSITTVMTKPKSRGNVKLKSNDPNDLPIIELNLLKHQDDLKMMIAGQKFFLRALQEGDLGKKVKEILIPSIVDLDDNKFAEHCKRFVRTNYHPVGTAKMGADNDKMAVLDSKLRVRGVSNLRVCDLSAMPNINSGNTSAPAMMLGLRCGDLLINSFQ